MDIIFRDINGNEYKLPKDREVTFRPGCYAIVKHKDKFLFILDEASGLWEFPGGGLDIGENFLECVVRETKEETGYSIRVINKEPFFVSTSMDYFRKKDTYHQTIQLFYVCELISEVRGKQNFDVDENILDIKFFTKEEMKSLDGPKIYNEAVNKIIEEL